MSTIVNANTGQVLGMVDGRDTASVDAFHPVKLLASMRFAHPSQPDFRSAYNELDDV